jgi:hypothetical protein
MITNNGRELSRTLSRYVGLTYETMRLCSLIARHSRTLRRLYEMECGDGIHSGEWVNAHSAWIEKRTEQIEERLRKLTNALPETDHGSISVVLYGDPRGYVVSLNVPTDNGPRTVGVW